MILTASATLAIINRNNPANTKHSADNSQNVSDLLLLLLYNLARFRPNNG